MSLFNTYVKLGDRGNSLLSFNLSGCTTSNKNSCTVLSNYQNVPHDSFNGNGLYVTGLTLYSINYIYVEADRVVPGSCDPKPYQMIPINGLPATPTPSPTSTPTPTPTPSSTPIPPTPTPTPTPTSTPTSTLNCVFDVVANIVTPTPTPTSTPPPPTPTNTTVSPTPTNTTVSPTPTITTYTIELRMNGMDGRNGSFVLYQSPDGNSWTESVTLTTTDNEVSIQSFNGTPGYYYRYVVTKTSGTQCRANAYNNILDGLLGDFNPGPIMTFSPYCEFDSVTHPSFQLPNPKQSRSYISFNGTLDGACL